MLRMSDMVWFGGGAKPEVKDAFSDLERRAGKLERRAAKAESVYQRIRDERLTREHQMLLDLIAENKRLEREAAYEKARADMKQRAQKMR